MGKKPMNASVVGGWALEAVCEASVCAAEEGVCELVVFVFALRALPQTAAKLRKDGCCREEAGPRSRNGVRQ